MKKRLILACAAFMVAYVMQAQPGWASKAAKSVFTLKTFAANGNLLGSSCGFFIGENGEAVSSFVPFDGAARAVIIDASGKEFPVEAIIGANDMYDVAKFRVQAKKTQPVTLASRAAAQGEAVWLLPYSTKKKPDCPTGVVRKAETILTDQSYYTLNIQMPVGSVGSPLLNSDGEVIGIMQQPANANDTLSYAISARYVTDLTASAFSLNDASLQKTSIKKALPDDAEQALLMLYMAGSSMDSLNYATLIDDYILKFPSSPDGYTTRAQLYVRGNDFATAKQNMEQAIRVSNKKDDTHFKYARMIYQKLLYNPAPFDEWTYDTALQEVHEAYSINPHPTYRHLEGQILFSQAKYDEAFAIFQELQSSEIQGASLYYEASRCKEMLNDTTAMLALLDSAVNCYTKPYTKDAAPYLWARALALYDTGKYRLAVSDFNEYEKLMVAQVNAHFYYVREQAEVSGRLYQQALNDITKATEMAPEEPLYWGEKASLEIRVALFDEAIVSATTYQRLAPNDSDGFLFLGIAQCQKGNKAEGLKNLQKALELGNEQAQRLIDKFK